MFSPDAKEQVRQATDIVELVGRYMQLRRQGRNYVGICPWHDDSRPSFQVNAERQSFKCWVCDIGGDVFSFVMKMDGLEFPEALQMLAERAGITLTREAGGPPQASGVGDKRTLLAALKWAADEYHRCFLSDDIAEEARDYVRGRNISAESIRHFQIGFAPNQWDWLTKRAAAARISGEVLDRVGLVLARNEGQGWYDRFRGRVMFPIHDLQSRTIAFGGRILPQLADDKAAKYVNSPETPVYSKSKELYALDLARDSVHKRKQIVVMEGYTDVIMAHQYGVTNAVACCGTALGERHLQVVRRLTDSIALVLDGDEAGQRRTNEILELFVANQIDLRILTLPNNLDPCDFIASHGSDEFDALLRQAPDALEHKLRSATNGMALTADNTHRATLALEQVLATLAHARPALGDASSAILLREQNLLSRLSRMFRMGEDSLRARLNELRKGRAKSQATAIPEGTRVDAAEELRPAMSYKLSAWETELIELMLLDADIARELSHTIGVEEVPSPGGQRLYQLCLDEFEEHHEIAFSRLMLRTEEESLRSALAGIDEGAQVRAASDRQRRKFDLLAAHQARRAQSKRQAELAALRDGNVSHEQQEDLLKGLFASRKEKQS